jgi:Holliday junction resolvase RusA-like endonuclease
MMNAIEFTIIGECASKANSRALVMRSKTDEHGRKVKVPMFIKSEKARAFEASVIRQIPPKARLRLEGPVFVRLVMFYASERPDLDESLLLDCLQDRYVKEKYSGKRVLVHHGCYRNDRQVRGKLVLHRIDRANPRTIVRIRPMVMQQTELEFNYEQDQERDDEACPF